MVIIIGVFIAFFLSLLIFTKKGRSKADTILGVWLIFTGIHLGLYYIFISKNYQNFPYFLGFEAPMPLFQGPLLYLYTVSLTNNRLSNQKILFHLLFPILWYILYLPFIFSPLAHKIAVYDQQGKGYERITNFTIWAIKISGVYYVIMAYLAVRKYQSLIKNQFSYIEKINLNWLRYLILGIAFIWLLVYFGYDSLIFTSATIFVLFIGFFGIKQVGIFTNELPQTIENENIISKIITENAIKYEKSGLSNEAALAIHESLKKIMLTEKLYTNPELSLAQLAKRLDTNSNNLSQVINTFEEKTFFDYINAMRVEEFKRLVELPENQKYTLLALAYDAGFNSKTSFNRNFKKVTNLSPSEYLKDSNIILE